MSVYESDSAKISGTRDEKGFVLRVDVGDTWIATRVTSVEYARELLAAVEPLREWVADPGSRQLGADPMSVWVVTEFSFPEGFIDTVAAFTTHERAVAYKEARETAAYAKYRVASSSLPPRYDASMPTYEVDEAPLDEDLEEDQP
jgi:hypothetical protein